MNRPNNHWKRQRSHTANKHEESSSNKQWTTENCNQLQAAEFPSASEHGSVMARVVSMIDQPRALGIFRCTEIKCQLVEGKEPRCKHQKEWQSIHEWQKGKYEKGGNQMARCIFNAVKSLQILSESLLGAYNGRSGERTPKENDGWLKSTASMHQSRMIPFITDFSAPRGSHFVSRKHLAVSERWRQWSSRTMQQGSGSENYPS